MAVDNTSTLDGIRSIFCKRVYVVSTWVLAVRISQVGRVQTYSYFYW